MARLVVAHRLEHRDVGPLALGRGRAVLLQHFPHRLAQAAQLVGLRAHHVARHDRRRRLPKRAGLHLVGEVRDRVAVHLEVDRDRRAAQFRVRGRRGVRLFQPADPRNCSGQFQDPAIIDVIQHAIGPYNRRVTEEPIDCRTAVGNYIGVERQAGKGGLPVWGVRTRKGAARNLKMRRPYRRRDGASRGHPVTHPARCAGRTERPWTPL